MTKQDKINALNSIIVNQNIEAAHAKTGSYYNLVRGISKRQSGTL